jgi:acetolactate synthase-1/2/3 large subunit
VDIPITADSSKAIPALTRIIEVKMTAAQRQDCEAHFHRIEGEHGQQRAKWRETALSRAGQKPISPEWLSHCIAEAVDEDTIVVAETVTNSTPLSRQLPRTKPGTLFSLGGSSLGWSVGAAVGAKLAARDRTVVCLLGDGAFTCGCPTAGLWAASVHRAPVLYVIFNNQGYNAIRRNLRSAFGDNNFAEKTGHWVGLDIMPSPDYALIARGCHAWGGLVEEPEAVKPALREALERVQVGQPAVLDVRIGRT